MRIHTRLEWRHLHDASEVARVQYGGEHGLEEFDSRSRTRAFNVHLTGSSGRYANSGRYGALTWGDGDMAATWDEWGIFLGHLFMLDPYMHTGKYGYLGRRDFDLQTGCRYTDTGRDPLLWENQHKNHHWSFAYADNLDGGPDQNWRVSECTTEGCTAERNFQFRGERPKITSNGFDGWPMSVPAVEKFLVS